MGSGASEKETTMSQRCTYQDAGRKRAIVLARLAAAAALATLAAVPGHTTPASGFVGTQVSKGQYGNLDIRLRTQQYELKLKTTGDSDIYVVRNAIAIGGQSGWHTHPGPSLITVTVGEIVAYDDQLCTPTRYGTGQSFVDRGDGHVHLLRNESGAEAETVAVQFLPRNAVRRIDAPQPNNCNF
jgi:quercetin dioxygenase-like cupin family protein